MINKYGYVRVSTKDQNEDRQLEAMKQLEILEKNIYVEKISGKDFKVSQTEYSQYRTAIEKWKKETGKEPVAHSIRAKLAEKKQEIQNEQKNKQHTRSQNKDRGAR